MRDLEVGDVVDGYLLQALVARGGMATVFKALERTTGRTVALKVPHLAYEADVVFYERFAREERLGLQLAHPNLVSALAPAGEKSRVYMVMEYVDGVPLSTLVEGGRPLDPALAVDVARQVCDALAYLHARGVVHRDVKPGNVLLTAAGQAKILDLGIARVAGARALSVPGLSASVGTPEYMAPEQRRGRHGDARVDVYALGTMLYQMLTGRLPYCGDPGAVLRAKRRQEPAPPRAHVPELDPGLEAIVLKALQRAPGDRYAAAVDMLAELRDPSAARRRAAGPVAPRRDGGVHRRRVAAAAAIVGALCALAGAAGARHLAARAERGAAVAGPPATGPGSAPRPAP